MFKLLIQPSGSTPVCTSYSQKTLYKQKRGLSEARRAFSTWAFLNDLKIKKIKNLPSRPRGPQASLRCRGAESDKSFERSCTGSSCAGWKQSNNGKQQRVHGSFLVPSGFMQSWSFHAETDMSASDIL